MGAQCIVETLHHAFVSSLITHEDIRVGNLSHNGERMHLRPYDVLFVLLMETNTLLGSCGFVFRLGNRRQIRQGITTLRNLSDSL